jgi:hypothetical protein
MCHALMLGWRVGPSVVIDRRAGRGSGQGIGGTGGGGAAWRLRRGAGVDEAGGSVGADEEVHGHRRRRLPAEARWPYRAYEGCNGVRRRGVKAGIL